MRRRWRRAERAAYDDVWAPSWLGPAFAKLSRKVMKATSCVGRCRLGMWIALLVGTTAFAPRVRHDNSPQERTITRATESDTATTATTIWTEQQLLNFASQQGVEVSLSTLGPAFRAIGRCKHNTTQILGYVEGFLRPAGEVLHLDKMEVFRKMVLQARRENPDEFKQGGTVFGVGLLLGYICLLCGRDNGYTVAEFLAIDDEEKQHQKLVQFYKRTGFKVIKYVGDDFSNIPDRMVWGGCGTLMKEDIDTLLQRWTQILQKS